MDSTEVEKGGGRKFLECFKFWQKVMEQFTDVMLHIQFDSQAVTFFSWGSGFLKVVCDIIFFF